VARRPLFRKSDEPDRDHGLVRNPSRPVFILFPGRFSGAFRRADRGGDTLLSGLGLRPEILFGFWRWSHIARRFRSCSGLDESGRDGPGICLYLGMGVCDPWFAGVRCGLGGTLTRKSRYKDSWLRSRKRSLDLDWKHSPKQPAARPSSAMRRWLSRAAVRSKKRPQKHCVLGKIQ
jgi:hypothetical protein